MTLQTISDLLGPKLLLLAALVLETGGVGLGNTAIESWGERHFVLFYILPFESWLMKQRLAEQRLCYIPWVALEQPGNQAVGHCHEQPRASENSSLLDD